MKKAGTKKSRDEVLELLVIIMLGVTAIFTAWATWIGSIHGANSAANYAASNNLAAEGNAEYNAGMQALMQDMMIYNDINNLMIDMHFAETRGNADEAEKAEWKIDELINGSMGEELAAAFLWAAEEALARDESVSPFEKEGFIDTYFESANELLRESEETLAQGQRDSANSDAYGLATVIYAVALFLLGVTATLKDSKNKTSLFAISIAAFLFATFYMLTLPLPSDFSFIGFIGGS